MWFVVVCGSLWWFVVVCGGLWWFVVVCGGLWWFVVFSWFSHEAAQILLSCTVKSEPRRE